MTGDAGVPKGIGLKRGLSRARGDGRDARTSAREEEAIDLTAGNRSEMFRFELRWPLVIQVLILILVLASLPEHTRLLPHWFSYSVATLLVLSMVSTRVSGGHPKWLSIESAITVTCCAWAELVNLATLVYVVRELLSRPEQFTGRHLLTSGVSMWVTNVFAFSIIYWSIDRGGPEARINRQE